MNIKKLLLVMVLGWMATIGVSAQSMTDDQVIDEIKKEYAKGTSQQQIVLNLMKKGVTTNQLQRVRRKVEQMQREQGLNELPGQQKASRMRTNKNMNQSQQKDKKNQKGQRSEGEDYQLRGTQYDNLQTDDYQVNGRGLYVQSSEDSLYYWVEQMEGTERQVFGRNIFNNENLSFQPSGGMATPQNYLLGPGDQVMIDVWGASQMTFDEVISPDGVVVIEGVGPIQLAGKTVQQAKATIKSKLGKFYGDCSFNLSVGETRTIQVQVMGEVNTPGTYSLSGLSSAFNALYAAGGISQIGTLRDIKVYRSGRQIASIDVYDYLVNGNSRGDVRLQDNDVIIVGPYDCLVSIEGKVKRPMWYEMKKTETVKELLRYSGGMTGDAYTKNVRLTRKAGNEYSVHSIGEFQMGSFTMMDEDVVHVDSVRARFSNMVEVRGAVKHAGQFQLGGEIQTVKELLIAADGFREDAYQEHIVMHRQKDDLTLEMVSVDIKGIMDGSVSDIPLKNGDLLFVPSQTEMQGQRTMQVMGEVAYPGTYPYAENATLRDVLLQAGGLTNAASLAKVDVFRRVRDAQAVTSAEQSAQMFTFSLDEHFNLLKDTVFMLMPYDIVMVRKSPSYEEQKNVTVRGEVNFQGKYAMLTKNYRLSDLIAVCGGVTEMAYVQGAHLTRIMTKEEVEHRDHANEQAQIQLYENALKEGKDINMQIADSLLAMKRNTSYTFPVAINLDKALAQPGSEYDLVLREGDLLEIPERSNIVKVSGEVMYPVSMAYEKSKNLHYYVSHAGGYSNNASKNKVYGIHTNGSVVRLHYNSVHDIQPGMEIVVPQKKARKKMSTAEIVGMSSAMASMGAIVVSVLNVLKK